MRLSVRSWISSLTCLVWLSGCAAPEEVDWRNRTDALEMRPDPGRDAIGVLTVAGRVDATVFEHDALWALVAVPTRRDLPVNRLIRIDLATNRFKDLFAVDGFSSGSLAVGHGAIWVGEGLGGNKVHRVDPVSQRIVASVTIPHNPVGVAVSDKAVWVLGSAAVSRIGGVLLRVEGIALFRIDPVSLSIDRQIPIPMPTTRGHGGLTAASVTTAAGAVWVATPAGEVVRVDPTNDDVTATFSLPDDGTARQATYRFITQADQLCLMRQVKARADLPAVSESLRTTVWELDTRYNRIHGESIHWEDRGLVVSHGSDGVWLGSTRVDAIRRVDPGTFNAGADTWNIGHPVYALVSGQGSLWAYAGAGISHGDDRNITWITRVRTAPRSAIGTRN